MSRYSGFSTASRMALAKKDEEMIKERQESAAEIAKLQAIILEKTIPVTSFRGNSTRGRPRGSRGGGGSRGGRGTGVLASGLGSGADPGMQFEDLMGLNAYPNPDKESKKKRDSSAVSPEIMLTRSERTRKNKLSNENDCDDSEGGSESEQDPRRGVDWKISRSKGFQKDRERKKKELSKKEYKKVSKTKKRNSTESMFETSMGANVDVEAADETEKTTPMEINTTKEDGKGVSTEVADLFAHLFDEELVIQASPTLVQKQNLNQNKEIQITTDTTVPVMPAKMLPTALLEISAKEKVMSWNTVAMRNVPPPVSNTQQNQLQASTNRVLNIPGQIKPLQDIVVANHDGAWREELEIELRGENGEAFTGTITMTEAKHGIYRDCLGFEDFKNFDGVRFSYKGIRLVTFKLKEQMDVDSLIGHQYFDYKRPVKRNGKVEFTTIRCKIRGLRSEGLKDYLERKEMKKSMIQEDGSTLVRITGCEYRVSSEQLKEILSHWGEVRSEPKEEVFHDPHDVDGTNRTGVYVVRMVLEDEIPELIPFNGLRIRVQHPDVKKLCTGCYGQHLRKTCNNAGRTWFDYVEDFVSENPDIPKEFYGSILERMKKTSTTRELPKRKPTLDDFNVPKSKFELDLMFKKMLDCGIDMATAAGIIKERKSKFDTACKDFEAK